MIKRLGDAKPYALCSPDWNKGRQSRVGKTSRQRGNYPYRRGYISRANIADIFQTTLGASSPGFLPDDAHCGVGLSLALPRWT